MERIDFAVDHGFAAVGWKVTAKIHSEIDSLCLKRLVSRVSCYCCQRQAFAKTGFGQTKGYRNWCAVLAGIQLQMLAIGGGIEISTGPHAGRLVVQGYAVKCFHNAAGTCNRSAVADHHPMNGFAGI